MTPNFSILSSSVLIASCRAGAFLCDLLTNGWAPSTSSILCSIKSVRPKNLSVVMENFPRLPLMLVGLGPVVLLPF